MWYDISSFSFTRAANALVLGLATSAGGTNVGVRALPLDSVTPQLLIRENVVFQPFWAPDSRSIAFFEDGKLKRADIAGGPAQIICDTPTPISAGAWNNDGVILFPGGGLIQRVLAAGGQPMPITALDESKQETEHVAPVFLPDGRHFLFLAVSSKPEAQGRRHRGTCCSTAGTPFLRTPSMLTR